MAFPDGWGRRHEIEIPASKVDTNCADFPIFLNKDNFDSEIFDADGSFPALNGGGDIRFSSDEAGTNRLPCEIVTFTTDNNPANGKAEIHVKRSLSSSSNTSIYVWYHKSGETQPAANDTYGSENVWNSNYLAVFHMNQDPSGSAPQLTDSTSNDFDMTSYGSMASGDLVDAKLGKGIDFDGTGDCFLKGTPIGGDTINTGISAYTLQAWAYSTDPADSYGPVMGCTIGHDHYIHHYRAGDDKWHFWFRDNTDTLRSSAVYSNATVTASQWYMLHATNDGSNQYLYVDGAQQTASGSYSGFESTDQHLCIGARFTTDTRRFEGKLDEVRVLSAALASGWISTEYNNQSSPSTFAVPGTPVNVGLSAVSSDVIGKYDIFNTVYSSSVGKYDVRGLVQSDAIGKYDSRGLVQGDITGKFDSRELVQADTIGKYDIFSIINSDSIGKFDILDIIQSDITGKFDARNIALSNITGKYDTIGRISSDSTGKFDVLGIIASDSTAKFGILDIVSSDSIGKFGILDIVQSDITGKYGLLNIILSNLTGRYDTAGVILSDSIGKFGVLSVVSSDSTAKFGILDIVSSDSIGKFDVFNLVQSDVTGKFDARNICLSNLVGRFDVLGIMQSDVTGLYDILSNMVFSDITGRYNMREFVQSDITGKYDSAEFLMSDVTGRYDLTTEVFSDGIGKFSILSELDDKLRQAVFDMLSVLGGDVFYRPASGINTTIQGAFQRDEPNQEAYVRGLDTATGTLTGLATDLGNVVYGDRFIIDDEWWMLDADGIIEKNLYLVDISLVRIDS